MNDEPKDCVTQLNEMKTDEFYIALQMAFENRKFDYEEACDEYNFPTRTAKLAVIRQILCG